MARRFASLAAVLFGLVLAARAADASAEQPWKVLPPTPELPPTTVAGPVHVNDIEMWRAEFGPRDGKPVIMVHGGLANANYFGRVIPFPVDEAEIPKVRGIECGPTCCRWR